MFYTGFGKHVTSKWGVVIVNWPLKAFVAPTSIRTVSELNILEDAWSKKICRFRKLSPAELEVWQAQQDRTPAEENESGVSSSSETPVITAVAMENGGAVSITQPATRKRRSDYQGTHRSSKKARQDPNSADHPEAGPSTSRAIENEVSSSTRPSPSPSITSPGPVPLFLPSPSPAITSRSPAITSRSPAITSPPITSSSSMTPFQSPAFTSQSPAFMFQSPALTSSSPVSMAPTFLSPTMAYSSTSTPSQSSGSMLDLLYDSTLPMTFAAPFNNPDFDAMCMDMPPPPLTGLDYSMFDFSHNAAFSNITASFSHTLTPTFTNMPSHGTHRHSGTPRNPSSGLQNIDPLGALEGGVGTTSPS